MLVEQLPGWLQNHLQAVSRVINEVSEDHGQTLQSVLFDVEKGSRVSLDDLHEKGHPRIESVLQARVH